MGAEIPNNKTDRAGSKPDSFEKLIGFFSAYIKHKAKGIRASGLDEDDLEQEGRIALFRAIETFDEALGVQFSAYARACIDNSMLSAARAAARKKNLPLAYYEQLDGVSQTDPSASPDDIVAAREQLDEVMDRVCGALSPFERRALALHLMGYDYESSAKLLGKSPKSVDNALQRARNKLKQSV